MVFVGLYPIFMLGAFLASLLISGVTYWVVPVMVLGFATGVAKAGTP